MARVNDVGGLEGFGALEPPDGEQPSFRADWEARVYGIHKVLAAQGVYAPDDLRDAVERLPPAVYLTASYYERWVHAIEDLLLTAGVLTPDDLAAGAHG